jgi:ATP-binding protein involved in chromosome partitioning
MISGLVVKQGNVFFAIEVPADQGAAKEPLRQACEKAIDRLPGVVSVTAVLTAHSDTATAPTTSAPQTRNESPKNTKDSRPAEIPGILAIVAVASAKGGVGKSTTAVNLALALSKLGLAVGLMDADIYGPSIPRMMGVDQRPQSSDRQRIEALPAFGVPTMSIGYLVPKDTPMIWRGPMVQSAIEQLLREVIWGALDVLVIDLPPGTGDAQLTLCQRVPLTGAVIVSTPQDVALADVRKGINMFAKVNVPILGVIENMSYHLCPHCGERSEIFGHGGAKTTAKEFGAEFLGEIPLHIAIRETSDAGQPIVVSQPDSAEAAAYTRIAERLRGRIDAAQEAARISAPRIVIQ